MSGSLSIFREAYGMFVGTPVDPKSIFWECTRTAFVLSAAVAWWQEHRALTNERAKNQRPEISVFILDALFDDVGVITNAPSGLDDETLISTRWLYITLVVAFRNLRPCNASIDSCSLVIETPAGILHPIPLSELGQEPQPVKLHSPPDIREMEPNLSVVYGLTVTRYARFAIQRRIDDDSPKRGTFVFSAIDSFGIDHVTKRGPGHWPSDPAVQKMKRYAPPSK